MNLRSLLKALTLATCLAASSLGCSSEAPVENEPALAEEELGVGFVGTCSLEDGAERALKVLPKSVRKRFEAPIKKFFERLTAVTGVHFEGEAIVALEFHEGEPLKVEILLGVEAAHLESPAFIAVNRFFGLTKLPRFGELQGFLSSAMKSPSFEKVRTSVKLNGNVEGGILWGVVFDLSDEAPFFKHSWSGWVGFAGLATGGGWFPLLSGGIWFELEKDMKAVFEDKDRYGYYGSISVPVGAACTAGVIGYGTANELNDLTSAAVCAISPSRCESKAGVARAH